LYIFYRPEALEPFQYSNIGIYVVIAHEIFILEDNSTYLNYQGVHQSQISDSIRTKIQILINHFNGAKTRTVDATRKKIFADQDELSLMFKALNSGLTAGDNIEDSGT